MNLLHYLDIQNNVELLSEKFDEGFLGNSIARYTGSENISDFKVGIIGLDDTRNNFPNKTSFNPDIVRNYLYSLVGFSKLPIIDFGNLKTGKTIDDTYALIKRITEYFDQKDIVIVLFGGTQEISKPISQSLFKGQNKLELSFIDAMFDCIHDSDFHSKSYLLDDFYTQEKQIVKNVLAFQTYLVSQAKVSVLKNTGYNLFRLGNIRNNFQSIEPILRDSDFVSMDLSAIRQADSPASNFKSPNGLYAEEACQLMNISGLSDKVKFLNINGIDTSKDVNGQSAHLLAQLIWHFIFGISNRKGEYPKRPLTGYKKIFINNEKLGYEFVFYKNEENNRFWVELPSEKQKRVEVIACAETDYISVCNNEIPERIWKRISNAMN